MKTAILTIVFLTATYISNAQQDTASAPPPDTVWRRGGLFSLNLSQVSLTNWSAGGENSLGGNAIVNYYANYKSGKNAWDNNIDLEYGVIMQGKNSKLTKSVDKIELNTIYGRQASKYWYYSVLANFRSQFSAGYNYPNDSTIISNFFAPAYITLALGMNYKPTDNFSLFLSPASARFIFVSDKTFSKEGAFGVDSGKTVRTEIGALVKLIYIKDLTPNFNVQTILDLFSSYLDKPQNVDVNWQLLLSYKLTKFISATLSTQLIYDDNTKLTFYKSDGVTVDHVGPGVQFREVFGVGFAYKPVNYTTRAVKQIE